MRRKILIIPSWYPNKQALINGIFVQDQAEILSRTYRVAVLAPRVPNWRQIIRNCDLPKSQIEDHGEIKIYREEFLVPPKFFRLRMSAYVMLARRGFRRILDTWGKPDMIHAHVVLPGGWVSVNLGREHGVPVVLTEHSGPFSLNLRSAYHRKLARETLTQVNRILAVSPAMARDIRVFCNPIEIEVVGNVIRTDLFSPLPASPEGPKRSGLRFFSVALWNKEKGLNFLIEAMHLLTKRGVLSAELIIGGDGGSQTGARGMVKELGLSDRCAFLGLLTRAEVRHWMQQCDVFVLPSLVESFGIVLGEAMACGKPVIATRCGGPEFIVSPETGLLVNPGDSAALAEAMNEFISGRVKFDPEVIRQSICKRFGEKAFLDKISSIYQKIWAD